MRRAGKEEPAQRRHTSHSPGESRDHNSRHASRRPARGLRRPPGSPRPGPRGSGQWDKASAAAFVDSETAGESSWGAPRPRSRGAMFSVSPTSLGARAHTHTQTRTRAHIHARARTRTPPPCPLDYIFQHAPQPSAFLLRSLRDAGKRSSQSCLHVKKRKGRRGKGKGMRRPAEDRPEWMRSPGRLRSRRPRGHCLTKPRQPLPPGLPVNPRAKLESKCEKDRILDPALLLFKIYLQKAIGQFGKTRNARGCYRRLSMMAGRRTCSSTGAD